MAMSTPLKRRALRWGATIAGLVALLYIPDCDGPTPGGAGAQPFVWNRDALWDALQARFANDHATCPATAALHDYGVRLRTLADRVAGPDDPEWDRLETSLFDLAVDVARCPASAAEFLEVRATQQAIVKDIARRWPTNTRARDRLYRLLYGSRAAAEEVLLQLPSSDALSLTRGTDVASAAPSIMVEGVRIYSGDLLLSRGGAPTSAFIARGSDYPGNFSHVALVHVDDDGQGSVIEAHIERGVAVSTQTQYFADKKLRVMVLRLRPDHPAVVADPLVAHRAASDALEEVGQRHIPYDFAMDFRDPKTQFCSEVASTHYATHGVTLWPNLTSFSSPGLARWMAGFGVEHLETHGPSDLEYDPSLTVVAEWHDRDTLFSDHVDNAVIDAMLERAEDGLPLGHQRALLPVARTLKAYSTVLNLFGAEGPVPEGMSATIALRATWLADTHAALRSELMRAVARFRDTHAYAPPYWELVAMARAAAQRRWPR